jgi:hypothetical protein
MYCPHCATHLADDAKFCRSCGLELQAISRILAEKSLTGRSEKPLSTAVESPDNRKSKWELSGIITVIAGLMVGCLIPIILGALSGYAGLDNLILIFAGLAGLLIFTGGALLISADALSKKRIEDKPVRLAQSGDTNPINRLPSAPDITEHTTESLKILERERQT